MNKNKTGSNFFQQNPIESNKKFNQKSSIKNYSSSPKYKTTTNFYKNINPLNSPSCIIFLNDLIKINFIK